MNLIKLLPEYYQDSAEVKDLQEAIQTEGNLSADAVEDLFLQLFLETATWGLTAWERVYGLKTDLKKPYNQRRSRVMSKMRGTGVTTIELIKNVAESFVNGLVEIVEKNSEYYFEVKMVDIKGIPQNMEDLKAAIEEIKPAHLAAVYVYLYRVWKEMKIHTWCELKSKNIKWGEIKEASEI